MFTFSFVDCIEKVFLMVVYVRVLLYFMGDVCA